MFYFLFNIKYGALKIVFQNLNSNFILLKYSSKTFETMRLNCEVAVQNWSSTQGVISRRKAARASVSIGRKAGRNYATENDGGDTVFLLLCTASNMSGTKYKVNIIEILK